jgi:hypothetical protein
MRETVRVSFDVPIKEHAYIKTACAKLRIALRDLMKEIFHRTYRQMRKKELHASLLRGFKEAYEGKTIPLTQEDLEKWEKMLDE